MKKGNRYATAAAPSLFRSTAGRRSTSTKHRTSGGRPSRSAILGLLAVAALSGAPAASPAASPSGFAPTVTIVPSAHAPDAPTGLDIDVVVPAAEGHVPPALKQAVVALPEGMSVSPAAIDGLDACSDAQLHLTASEPAACPDASKVGTVTATAASGPGSLAGGIFVRAPESGGSGSAGGLRIVLVLENDGAGAWFRVPGRIDADSVTGRLRIALDDVPDLPLSHLHLMFKGGPRGLFATPLSCGLKTVDATLTSWTGETVERGTTFEIDCTPGLGDFGPSFTAGVSDPTAGASSPFAFEIGRPDGQPDLQDVRLDLPEGLLPTIKGRLGTRVGTATLATGPGPAPLWRTGPVILEGHYGDAPYSLRVVVPPPGPLNLGEVVVRQKLYVDPHDAHLTVVSDPLPNVVAGVPVRLRKLALAFDEPGFMRNPSSCAPKAVGGILGSVAGQTSAVSAPLQFGGCDRLPLKPEVRMAMTDRTATKQGRTTPLVATMTQAAGQTGLRRVSVTLPPTLALMAENAHALCKPEQAAAQACPAGSIIGRATVTTPLLDEPLTGHVYFVEGLRRTASGRMAKTLPKMWVALRGPIGLDLWTETDLQGDRLVHRFGFLPDAPITAVRFEVFGGKHGVLAVSARGGKANVCAGDQIADAVIEGQNGKRLSMRPRISTPCRFAVIAKTLSSRRLGLRLGGVGPGRLAVSGTGIATTSRRIGSATVATLHAPLTRAGRSRYRRHAKLRLRVSFRPAGPGATSKRASATVRHVASKASRRTAKRRARP